MAYGVDDTNSAASMPTPSTAVSSGWFQPGNFNLNLPATTITCDVLNGILAEILNVVTAGGLTPSKTTLNQMVTAINNIVAAKLATGVVVTGQTNGAASSAGTLTNAPAAGNPTFWLPITVNGVVKKVPCW